MTAQNGKSSPGGEEYSRWKVDYESLITEAQRDPRQDVITVLAEELPFAWRDAYLEMVERPTNIVRFLLGTFEYVYDDSSSPRVAAAAPAGFGIEARLVAVSGCSCPQERKRDDYRLKGWVGPTEETFGRDWDKGHFIAHSIGGAVDRAEVNVFVQRRDLNRGWSAEGRRYREMEKYCELNRGTFCFSRPVYFDQTARPAFVEFGLLKNNSELWVECFENR